MPPSALKALLGALAGHGTLDDRLGDRPCLADDTDVSLTYAEVVAAAGAQAAALRRLAGGMALLAPRNDIPSVVALLAAWGAGLAIGLVDPAINPQARDAIVAAFRPEVVALPGVEYIADRVAEPPVRSGTGILLSTSGTTGSSKFVRLSNAALFANADQIACTLGILPDDVGACHLPLHYSYGLSVLLSHLERGAAVLLTEAKITSVEFLARLAAGRATHFPGVPFHYTVLARLGPARLGLNRLMPPSVRTFTQAGGHLDVRLREVIHEQVRARGGAFYMMYGQTEAAPRMTTLAPERFPRKPGSVGAALPGGRIEILQDDGATAPVGSVGQVVYSGPNVMWGYATSRDCLARGDEMNGRLETGDTGWLDAEGDLFITGRNRRLAKIAGLRINLDEVELRLKAEFEIALLPGDEAILVFTAEASKQRMDERLAQLAGEYSIPARSFRVRQIHRMPHLASGKVDCNALRELA
jgi:acyl-CoA synthetase (AMP-forming)/AMP-acid ligase II